MSARMLAATLLLAGLAPLSGCDPSAAQPDVDVATAPKPNDPKAKGKSAKAVRSIKNLPKADTPG